MEDKLRDDLKVILLEECFGMLENYARLIVREGPAAKTGNLIATKANQEALDAVDHAMQRIESRCSKIEG